METTAVESMYSRQNGIDFSVINPNAVVIGVGGVGFWVAVNLAMIGSKHICLIDNDLLSLVNLNRIPAPAEYVGKPKVEFTKKFIKLFRPECEVIALHTEWKEELLSYCPPNAIFYECTDDFNAQCVIEKFAKKRNGDYGREIAGIWHVHYNGLHSFTIESFLDVDKEWGEVQNRYAVVNSMCPSAMIAGGLGVYYSLMVGTNNFQKSIIL